MSEQTAEPVPPTTAGEEDPDPEPEYKNESECLRLETDEAADHVKEVVFRRDGNVHENAALVLGLPPSERLRCFHLPMFEKKLGWSVHMYIDLAGVEHKMEHNTNATQLWLIANLPDEPPEVQPDAIHGAALVTAEDMKTEEYVPLRKEQWDLIVAACKEVQPNAQFLA